MKSENLLESPKIEETFFSIQSVRDVDRLNELTIPPKAVVLNIQEDDLSPAGVAVTTRDRFGDEFPIICINTKDFPMKMQGAFFDQGGTYIIPKEDEAIVPRMVDSFYKNRGIRSKEAFPEGVPRTIRPFDGLVLLPDRREVFINGKTIGSITSVQYLLLKTLAESFSPEGGGLVSAERLRACEDGRFLSRNALKVHMSNLRGKIYPFSIVFVESDGVKGYTLSQKVSEEPKSITPNRRAMLAALAAWTAVGLAGGSAQPAHAWDEVMYTPEIFSMTATRVCVDTYENIGSNMDLKVMIEIAKSNIEAFGVAVNELEHEVGGKTLQDAAQYAEAAFRKEFGSLPAGGVTRVAHYIDDARANIRSWNDILKNTQVTKEAILGIDDQLVTFIIQNPRLYTSSVSAR